MYEIEMHEPSPEFAQCWSAAGRHLLACAHDTQLSWLKATLTPPFLEHMSFRVGNQLFFIRIEDVSGRLDAPGNPNGVLVVADGCNGTACLMPMRPVGNEWEPNESGWGLVGAKSGTAIDPAALVTDEQIEMTDWEVHDLAVQIVRDHLESKLGHQLMSTNGNPDVDPSIWFVGDHGPEWVVVRAVRYPALEATLPPNIDNIAEICAGLSRVGHFGSVSVANSEDAFDPGGGIPPLPLWRGHEMTVRFEGLASAKVH
jgi:hypothetical protein